MNAAIEAPPVDRRRFIGGSDAAAILGLAPATWESGTPLAVYLKKRGEWHEEEDPAREAYFRRGKREEPRIVDDIMEDYGIKVTKRSSPEAPNRYQDPVDGFLACEVDFEWEVTREVAERYKLPLELVGTVQNGEAKSSHQFMRDTFGEAETEEVPVHYATQAMHGLMVTGRRLCMFAVKHGFDVSFYWVWRDEETIKLMRPKLIAFWRNVQEGIAPDPIRIADVFQLFRRSPPISVDCSEEAAQWYEELERAKQAVKSGEDMVEEFKFRLGRFMLGADKIEREVRNRAGELGSVKPTAAATPGRHRLMYMGVPLIVVSLDSRTGIEAEKLRKLHPAVARECSKTSTFFKFRKPTKEEMK